jgi:hypothetical protein
MVKISNIRHSALLWFHNYENNLAISQYVAVYLSLLFNSNFKSFYKYENGESFPTQFVAQKFS